MRGQVCTGRAGEHGLRGRSVSFSPTRSFSNFCKNLKIKVKWIIKNCEFSPGQFHWRQKRSVVLVGASMSCGWLRNKRNIQMRCGRQQRGRRWSHKSNITWLFFNEFNLILYQSIDLWMVYRKGFQTNPTRWSVCPLKIPESRAGGGRWRRLTRSVFRDLRPNASSDRLPLKNKIVERFKSYRLVQF